MDITEIKDKALLYNATLNKKKLSLAPQSFWYRYGTLNNFIHLDKLLTGSNRHLLDLIGKKTVVDIGSADGDLAFFMESLGLKVDIIDHAHTNYNHLEGAHLLRKDLKSSLEIYDIDLDSQFSLPQKEYGLIFFLGILYHLKNPFYILENLSKHSSYCLISTRVARLSPNKQVNFSTVPVAYLLDSYECNNDPTNFWIFSDAGLRRILQRTGWEICDYITVGNTTDSDPATPQGDERAFCLVKSSTFTP
jgi:2-polyprenyl-3-methyl-5-hydroxy-6-metoxy-1,4-benzoquinol methylase